MPDREGKTLEAWLLAHPGIELVTRDRSSIYANAISTACPQATQVADRWHLLKNLSETVERFVDTQRASISEVVQNIIQETVNQTVILPVILTETSLPLPIDRQPVSTPSQTPVIPTDKRYAVYQKAKELQQQGHGIRAVTRHLGAARNTIKQYFRQDSFVPRPKPKRSNLYSYEAYLRRRWLEGETCVMVLFEEIKAQGYNGGYTILTTFLADYPRLVQEPALPPAQKGISYSSRRLSRLLSQEKSEWSDEDRSFLEPLLNQNELIGQVYQLSLGFRAMMKAKQADGLKNWCVEANEVVGLSGFVRGIRQDYAAVKEAFRSEWSNGQTEGQVNRLKTIKRAMYGKANFELLRLRVLARNWTAPPN